MNIALFHFHVTQIKRSAGQSAVAAAAYRAGEKLHSEYYGEISDYTRKGGVICSEILLPSHVPQEYADRETLWNAVEKAERGKKAQLPMTDEVYRSLQNILSLRKRVKTETIIDGYSGFLLLDKNDSPKVALHIENEMRWAMKKYQELHPDKPLPHITPHVFRHTFCTNMANAGMDIKTLQYVMGHSDVGVTLNVYTHASYDRAAEQMAKIIDFKGLVAPEPQRKSG